MTRWVPQGREAGSMSLQTTRSLEELRDGDGLPGARGEDP